MRYAFPQYFESKSRFLTYALVYRVLAAAGHEVVANADGCDAVLFSMCDVTEYKQLAKLRASTSKPLIVGGAYAFNYWSAILMCDAVWIGEIFDFADCATLADVFSSEHCYAGDATKRLVASQRIEWDKVSVCQIAPGKCYYWGGAGCKNKCRFCFTSWTHAHQCNSEARMAAAKRVAKAKKMHLMIASNEYDAGEAGGTTRDMLLVDYLKQPVSGASFIRCGIEFATAESRARCGKPISDAQITDAIRKASVDNVSLRFFHITGYDALSDWERYVALLGASMRKHPNARLVHLMFNNLQYQNYTPMYAERRTINPDNYINISTTKRWYDELRQSSKHVLVGAPSPFQHVACRMGVELSASRDQLDYWLSMSRDPVHKLTVQQAYDALFSTGIFDAGRRSMNINTGEIRIVDERSSDHAAS